MNESLILKQSRQNNLKSPVYHVGKVGLTSNNYIKSGSKTDVMVMVN